MAIGKIGSLILIIIPIVSTVVFLYHSYRRRSRCSFNYLYGPKLSDVVRKLQPECTLSNQLAAYANFMPFALMVPGCHMQVMLQLTAHSRNGY